MRSIRALQIVAALAFVTPTTSLLAQQKAQPPATAKPGTAEILGIVIDSLNGRYLVGADVVIQGAQATVVTDSLGRFRVDNLAP